MNKLLLMKTLIFYFGVAVAICGGLFATPLHAQVFDGVEFERRSDVIVVKAKFAAYVQLMRYAPLASGKDLRIYINFTGVGVDPNDLRPQTMRFPREGDIPEMTVRFPEPDNSLLVIFDQPTKYTVRSGSDGRSVIILLPINK